MENKKRHVETISDKTTIKPLGMRNISKQMTAVEALVLFRWFQNSRGTSSNPLLGP